MLNSGARFIFRVPAGKIITSTKTTTDNASNSGHVFIRKSILFYPDTTDTFIENIVLDPMIPNCTRKRCKICGKRPSVKGFTLSQEEMCNACFAIHNPDAYIERFTILPPKLSSAEQMRYMRAKKLQRIKELSTSWSVRDKTFAVQYHRLISRAGPYVTQYSYITQEERAKMILYAHELCKKKNRPQNTWIIFSSLSLGEVVSQQQKTR